MLRRGYIAGLAPQGVPNADIVVTDIEGTRLCSIQVKTRRDLGSDGGWHMKAKHEKVRGDRLFYCFGDFGKSPMPVPTVRVLPSAVLAEVLVNSHQERLAVPRSTGSHIRTDLCGVCCPTTPASTARRRIRSLGNSGTLGDPGFVRNPVLRIPYRLCLKIVVAFVLVRRSCPASVVSQSLRYFAAQPNLSAALITI